MSLDEFEGLVSVSAQQDDRTDLGVQSGGQRVLVAEHEPLVAAAGPQRVVLEDQQGRRVGRIDLIERRDRRRGLALDLQKLRNDAGSRGLRLVEAELDQCWDLLRQRRALRETGGEPREAQVRPAGEVEGYLS